MMATTMITHTNPTPNVMEYSRAVKGQETQEEKDTEIAIKNSLTLEYTRQMRVRDPEDEQIKQAIQTQKKT